VEAGLPGVGICSKSKGSDMRNYIAHCGPGWHPSASGRGKSLWLLAVGRFWPGAKALWDNKNLLESLNQSRNDEKFFASWGKLSHIAGQSRQGATKVL